MTLRPAVVAALAVVVSSSLLGACTRSPSPQQRLFAETASFDLSSGLVPRLMVGVSDKEGNALVGGTVQVRLRRADAAANDPWSSPVPAKSLGIPGRPQPSGASPHLSAPSEGVGVYATGPVTIPSAGFWEVQVDAGSLGTAVTAFEASERPQAVAVGQPAPPTDNPTIHTPGVRASQLDSLALDDQLNEMPHPELHDTSVAESIAAHRPQVIVVATPAYCQSRFCGPLVDSVAALMKDYPDIDATMLEVYPNGYDKPVSADAARWISVGGVPEGAGNEPWVFTVDSAGLVSARWDNVVDLDALKAELDRLRQ